jgi:hypothetical protein
MPFITISGISRRPNAVQSGVYLLYWFTFWINQKSEKTGFLSRFFKKKAK